ncbi:MAG: ATP-binding protein [Chloroflexi bacterium]|nr:ATP-binding protein [Chloroflexota bacterium]
MSAPNDPETNRPDHEQGRDPRADDRVTASPLAGSPAGEAGKVLGTRDSQPLDFWIAVNEEHYLQLDDVVAVPTTLPEPLPDGTRQVMHYGVVDVVQSAYEGATFHSDVFRVEEGQLPVGLSTIAHVSATRIEPEVFVPPRPGGSARRASGDDRRFALYFDRMQRRFPAGLSRDGQPVYGNLEFLDGTKGAHVNISGISGVATKTSYALFLLYGLFHGRTLANPHAAHAIVFNVKGEDLLWLDRPNARLEGAEAFAVAERQKYAALELPVQPFGSVGLWAPSKPGLEPIPDTGGRIAGVTPYFWTLREFCRDRLLRFLFADADDEASQLAYAISVMERQLETAVESSPEAPWIRIGDEKISTFDQLVQYITEDHLEAMTPHVADGTRGAFARRLHAAATAVGPLIRGAREADAREHRFDWTGKQVNVIDINRLSDRAKRFVVGVVVKRLMEEKERQGTREPLVFLVLDELNKYAPREGHSPIKDVVLDIAERGRSLGVVLVGAQQTASEIERRITANASFRVVGRLDTAEGQRDEYGFLTSQARARSALLKPGSMFLSQPDVPVPLMVQFPFPAWATRAEEAAPDPDGSDVPSVFRRAALEE